MDTTPNSDRLYEQDEQRIKELEEELSLLRASIASMDWAGSWKQEVPADDGYYWVKNEPGWTGIDGNDPYVVVLENGLVDYMKRDRGNDDCQVPSKHTKLWWGPRVFVDSIWMATLRKGSPGQPILERIAELEAELEESISNNTEKQAMLDELENDKNATHAKLAELEADAEDAALLLGDSWKQVVDIAKGEQGVETALRIQCTGLAGDVAVLKDKLDAIFAAQDKYENSKDHEYHALDDFHNTIREQRKAGE